MTAGGRCMAATARDLEVRPDMLRRWKRQLEEDPVEAFPGKENLKSEEDQVRWLQRELVRVKVAQVTHGNGIVDTQTNDPNAMQRSQSIAATFGTEVGAADALEDGQLRLRRRRQPHPDRRRALPRRQSEPADLGLAAARHAGLDGPRRQTTPSTPSATSSRSAPPAPATRRRARRPTAERKGTTYDAAGNLTAWNGATYKDNGLNQLKHYVNGSQEWLYLYDADDERLELPAGHPRHLRPLRPLDHPRPRRQVLRTYEASGYNWTGSDVEDSIYRDGVLLAAELPDTGAIHQFHLDHLQTPASSPTRTTPRSPYHAYFPFGKRRPPFKSDDKWMEFNGHERDLASAAGTGDDLDYMHERFFNPLNSRFETLDPVLGDPTLPQSWNRFLRIEQPA